MKANVKGVTVERVAGGFRVCGTIDADRIFVEGGALPVCVVVKDSQIRRALAAVVAEARRFAKRVRGWFK